MKTQEQELIKLHGEALQALYPATQGMDPVELCKKLRRIENKCEDAAIRLCNGGVEQEECEAITKRQLDRARAILGEGGPEIFCNLDPRGYALKIDTEALPPESRLLRDNGGYGIIAPDLS